MKLLDTAEIKDIQSLITNDNVLNVRVNFYQRPYRWTAKKVTDLFEDYKDNSVSVKKGGSDEYFIGAVVLVDERKPNDKRTGKKWKYQVVDGQQRLTTLFLFNYLKFILLVKRADEEARSKKSSYAQSLKSIEKCYKGFIGKNNTKSIEMANNKLIKAFDDANSKGESIALDKLNEWRQNVGWIADPDISLPDYFEKCRNAMQKFLQEESLAITYENDNFNQYFKMGLANIAIKFSNASEAAFCEEPIESYDENDDTKVEFPYVLRAYGIFDQIKKLYSEKHSKETDPYKKLCGYIDLIDEMLENIKLCMIVTSDEDDAYKLFETLNDRSESVNDLELLKNYFYRAYTQTSGEKQDDILKNISQLDIRWREIFFKYEELEPEIFECMAVLFTGDTSKNTNERKRKIINNYLKEYKSKIKPYRYEEINRDFCYMEYIQKILFKIHRMDASKRRKLKDDSMMSLFIENDANASIVKRALGLAMNVSYEVVAASLICDVIHNFTNNALTGATFDAYLNDVFNENECKKKYSGLWKDACVLWQVIILSKNYESPKLLSDILAEECNISKMASPRQVNDQIIQLGPLTIEEKDVLKEFDEWISEWKYSERDGKLKIKNLFMHVFLKYDFDISTNKLKIVSTILRTYADDAIKQDLDHMEAQTIKKGEENKYFHYKDSDRKDYTNGLGNMMPLPVAINRGKHNTPLVETIKAFPTEDLNGWIFDEAIDLFNSNKTTFKGNEVPNEDFFNKRKDRLIDYFKRVVQNQIYSPNNEV